MIAGGPGQSALDTYQSLAGAFRHLTRDRDMVLIDQRGTGQSNKLNCPALPETLGNNTTGDLEQIRQQANACLDSLEMDPRYFSTSVAVMDLEAVRQQLGISQWNLYGISYGTRVALHYLRRFPDSVRTIALDAVVPPPVALGPEIATLAQRSLNLIFERCQQNPGCADAFGHQGESVAALLEELDRHPQTIRYEDISTGTQTTRTFTRDDLAMTLRLMSYSSQTASILPSMLHQAISYDNFAPLARQSDRQSSLLGDTLATGMHHTIVCTEDVPFYLKSTSSDEAPDDLQDESINTYSYLGEDVVELIRATCQQWPQGVIDDDFKEPVRSSVPALILSGETDPITPPDYGRQVAATLSNAHHIVNSAEGHMQVATGCIPVVLAKFVDQASIEDLDDDCLERIRPLPFFVDANGPLP
jgi:pimeloyl-ACP methyl ester carboxylesterase